MRKENFKERMSQSYINQMLKRTKKLPKHDKFLKYMSGEPEKPVSFQSIREVLRSMPTYEEAE